VLALIAEGLTNAAIARRLRISASNVVHASLRDDWTGAQYWGSPVSTAAEN
jgi:hypothetical protein